MICPMGLIDKLRSGGEASAAERRAAVDELLRHYAGRLQRASDLEDAPASAHRAARTYDEVLPFARRHTDGPGTCLISRIAVSVTAGCAERLTCARHGEYLLPVPDARPSAECCARALALLTGDEAFLSVPLQRILFLDTETTGVSGNCGTLPFLIGAGWFEGEGADLRFVCEQFFAEDFCHEETVLRQLGARLDKAEALATYNGAAYDLPLLRARAILNRLRLPLDHPHADLLPAARFLYKARIGSCSLSHVEREVLGLRRVHDCPGALVPGIFFDGLRGVRRDRMAAVFDHNAQDIISLGALVLHVAAEAESPSERGVHPRDLIAWSRLHTRRGDAARARQFADRAVTAAREPDDLRDALRLRIRHLKAEGAHWEAAELASQLWANARLRDAGAAAELAKLLEHRVRDHARALTVVEEALALAGLTAEERSALTHRRGRLLRRLAVPQAAAP